MGTAKDTRNVSTDYINPRCNSRQDDYEEDYTNYSEIPRTKDTESSPLVNELWFLIHDEVKSSNDLLKGMKNNFS